MQLVAWHNHAELLRRPLCRRVVRHVPVEDSPGARLQDHKHVKHSKCRGDYHEEVACEHGSRVIADERVLSKNPIDAKTECLCGSVLALGSSARQRFW